MKTEEVKRNNKIPVYRAKITLNHNFTSKLHISLYLYREKSPLKTYVYGVKRGRLFKWTKEK